MPTTFAGQLKSFAYAIDLIDIKSYLAIRDIVLDYTQRVLDIDFTHQLVLSESDGKPALLPYALATEGRFTSVKTFDENNTIKTQAAYCFVKDCPLWIVSNDPENT